MTTALVTGGNRGIGLELCRRFAARGDEVVAACRKASPELRETGVEIHEGIDVTNDESVRGLVRAIDGPHPSAPAAPSAPVGGRLRAARVSRCRLLRGTFTDCTLCRTRHCVGI